MASSSHPASATLAADDSRFAPRRLWWLGLLTLGWFNLVSAAGGGIGLIVTNGLGMPQYLLDASPFDSFVAPGVILLVIVGGTQALAVLLQHRGHPWYPAAAGVAGFGLLIWMYVEIALLPGFGFLMALYVAAGVLQLVFLLLCLGILPGDRPTNRPTESPAHRPTAPPPD
jgi:hypothetical protein